MPDCSTSPFSGCGYSKKMIHKLIEELKVEQFVETGTYKGHTTQYIVDNFSKINVTTIESNDTFYQDAKNKFSSYPNITCVKQCSSDL